MLVRFWGARGSIPVSGKEYLRYGGDTTCVEIRTKEDEIIIIDAGTGIRKLGNELLKEGRRKFNIIFTHAHWDHIIGLPFFKPLYVNGTYIEMLGCQYAQKAIEKIISGVLSPPYFPVYLGEVKSQIAYGAKCESSISISSVEITPIFLNHPNYGMGYKLVEDGKCFVFLTDNEIAFKHPDSTELAFKHPSGLDYENYLNFSLDADLLVHDAEYTQEEYNNVTRGWGHSIYKDALRLAIEARAKRIGLYHHNQDRTDRELDEIVDDCQQIIKDTNAGLECFAVYPGMEFRL